MEGILTQEKEGADGTVFSPAPRTQESLKDD